MIDDFIKELEQLIKKYEIENIQGGYGGEVEVTAKDFELSFNVSYDGFELPAIYTVDNKEGKEIYREKLLPLENKGGMMEGHTTVVTNLQFLKMSLRIMAYCLGTIGDFEELFGVEKATHLHCKYIDLERNKINFICTLDVENMKLFEKAVLERNKERIEIITGLKK